MTTSRSQRAYRNLLVLLPASFRDRHADELEAGFVELLGEASATRGWAGVVGAWIGGARDLLWQTFRLRLPRIFAPHPRRTTPGAGGGGGKPGRAPFVELGSLGRELKVAARTLRRTPGFTIIAVLTLALGIGLNVAVFSIVNGVLLRPLPYPEPDRLVQLWGAFEAEPTPFGMASLPDLDDWADAADGFAALAGYTSDRRAFSGGGEPAMVETGRVTEGFFDALGIAAARGRVLRSQDFDQDAPAATVISAGAWRTLFAADPGVLGRSVRLGDDSYTVIGVLSERDHALPSPDTAFWIPQEAGMHRGSRSLNAIGRLAAGVTPAQAQDEMDGITDALAAAYPDSNADRSVQLVPLADMVVGDGARLLLVLFGATGLVLIIAAVNLVGLLHARALDRGHELSIRSALGASRANLAWHLGAEALLLAAGGGLLGVAAAYLAVNAFVALAPADIPRLEEVALDAGALLFATLVTLGLGLIVGLVPALRAPATRRTGRNAPPSRRDRRGWLVAIEVAASVVLVVGAGLLVRSFERLQSVDTGFDADGVLSLRLDLPESRYAGAAEVLAFHERLLERIAAEPGVTSVGGVTVLPFARGNLRSSVAVDGSEREDLEVEFRSISHDYFGTMGMTLLAGRVVGAVDTRDTPPVTVVNRTLARRAWGDEDPIGRTVTIFDRTWTVVGVVSDVRHFGLAQAPVPEMYVAFRQQPRRYLTWVVRTAGDPAALLPPLRAILRDADAELPMIDVATMRERVWMSAAAPRFRTGVLGALALAALVLAVVGIYGVASFAVGRRTREIGIRRALGARTTGVVGLVIARSMFFVAAGMVAGAALAAGLAGSLRNLLFEIEPLDPTAFAAALIVIGGAALLGCLFPALRAAAIDPMSAIGETTPSR